MKAGVLARQSFVAGAWKVLVSSEQSATGHIRLLRVGAQVMKVIDVP
jgi:hypothetical protein